MTRDELRAEIEKLWPDRSLSERLAEIRRIFHEIQNISLHAEERIAISKKLSPAECDACLRDMHELTLKCGSKAAASLMLGYNQDYIAQVSTGQCNPSRRAWEGIKIALLEPECTVRSAKRVPADDMHECRELLRNLCRNNTMKQVSIAIGLNQSAVSNILRELSGVSPAVMAKIKDVSAVHAGTA